MIMALGLHKIHYVASGWRRWRVPGIFIGYATAIYNAAEKGAKYFDDLAW